MVHRKGTDSVAIIPYFFNKKGDLNIYLNRGIRPAIYFRKILRTTVPDRIENLYNYEAMAGSIEEDDKGGKDLIARAREEIIEELGYRAKRNQFEKLGAGFYPSHGQSSEKIHLLALLVRPEERMEACGDGSVNEGDSLIVVLEAKKILRMCEKGMIEDPKIEIGVSRLCKKLRYS
jgi:8-oxo-dGTP pyrophosphatase MutT (NUDIX family)